MTIDTFADYSDMALNLVDLDRYPIADLDQGEGAAFLLRCQQHIEQHGWCSFDGFIRPDALAAETKALLPGAEVLNVRRNIFQGEKARG